MSFQNSHTTETLTNFDEDHCLVGFALSCVFPPFMTNSNSSEVHLMSIPLHPTPCVQCGTLMQRKRSHKILCSGRCRMARSRQRRKDAGLIMPKPGEE